MDLTNKLFLYNLRFGKEKGSYTLMKVYRDIIDSTKLVRKQLEINVFRNELKARDDDNVDDKPLRKCCVVGPIKQQGYFKVNYQELNEKIETLYQVMTFSNVSEANDIQLKYFQQYFIYAFKAYVLYSKQDRYFNYSDSILRRDLNNNYTKIFVPHELIHIFAKMAHLNCRNNYLPFLDPGIALRDGTLHQLFNSMHDNSGLGFAPPICVNDGTLYELFNSFCEVPKRIIEALSKSNHRLINIGQIDEELFLYKKV
ncbi:uncharacterized protein NDAI_0B06120 [Naumovozyma dairenensis CBS 421]|uniref:Uncharacterized protein n=1 Tax=Naumovozyma dairenensis (strain ATCC 10597 / BCRC 20456 / CBS 421 / NBRC 0211 / NRRL Y-12639) TaxID=1071378 RepID=G0W783_NAUDC|nr:hypothetical protein NDAI_0B06120 [Naumovozyma dairenensis CBS 421]CCD23644.1 hypothetical protein NDAI_0B06120 [Naumovozyma dairenensis CBS 421]